MSSTRTDRTKPYWGTQRVARVCQVTPSTVASWIDQGHLKGHRTPTGHRRVASDDLAEFLRSHGMALPPELNQSAGRPVVVMVEDDPAYLKALTRYAIAKAVSFDLATAENGVDGLLEIGRVRPGVIVLDYRLPDLNAVQIIERLLEPGRRLEAEVVVVTGGVTADEEQRVRALGVRTIVDKGDGFDAVLAAIEGALARRAAVSS
ncbi:MAG TPA: response regulator [Gemmatimonadales bacterium]|nr:response regulator [Gemmatimonadales bacterium]